MPAVPMPEAAVSRLELCSVAEAVQAIEADGALEDHAALHAAARMPGSSAEQALQRAWLLGQRLGLPAEWARWRHPGWLVLAALAVLMVLSAWALAQAVVGEARGINVMAALVAMLGLHGLTLLAWLAGLLWSQMTHAPGTGSGWSLGALALRLTARLPLDRGPHAAALLQGTTRVLQRHRLAPWVFGALSHAIWALAFVLMLLALWLGFSFRAYQLTWETTILSDSFFQHFVQISGWLPAQLGFAVPDAAAVQAAGSQAAGDQRAWAWWLMGCVLCYGLLPRAALALLCVLVWQGKQKRLALDVGDPYVRRQMARLEALAPRQVVDVSHDMPARAAPVPFVSTAAAGEAALLGFELPPNLLWPPASWTPAWQPATPWMMRIAGSSDERHTALDALAVQHPRALLIAVSASASPDRGTARFVRQAQATTARSALLLLGLEAESASNLSAPPLPAAAQRWRDWLAASQLEEVAMLGSTSQADAWLAGTGEALPHV